MITFDKLLEKDNSFTFQYTDTLCIELNKVYNNLSQTIFSNCLSEIISNYNLRSQSNFDILEVKTFYKGCNSLQCFEPIIWDLIPEEIKYSDSLDSFVSKIPQWKPNTCPCRSSNHYISNIRFVEKISQLFNV